MHITLCCIPQKDHSEIEVIKSPIEDFLNGGFLEVRVFSKKELKEKFPNKKIVEIALSKIGEKGYNLLYNNCEHFANFCVFGKKISFQVENIHEQIKNVLNKKYCVNINGDKKEYEI